MSEKDFFDNLSDELKAKLRACKTEDELKKVLADAGIELDPDALADTAGGAGLASGGGLEGGLGFNTGSDLCPIFQSGGLGGGIGGCPTLFGGNSCKQATR